jgi:arginine/lysine/ornithine decarboxylase
MAAQGAQSHGSVLLDADSHKSSMATIVQTGSTPTPDPLTAFHQQANVKLEDNGKVFTFTVTRRFTVFWMIRTIPKTN